MSVDVTDVRDVAVALAREAGERRKELDAGQRIPADLFERAGEAGLFRQLIPVELGGLGLAPIDWFRTSVEMARHEPSFGWVVSQGAGDLATFVTSGSRRFAEEFLADRCAYIAGSDVTCGALVPDGDGFRLSGRWPLCSGSHGATWVGGEAAIGDGDDAERRYALVPVERARIEESWDVIGMIGTGSHTIIVEDQPVPADWTFRIDLPAPHDHGRISVATGNGYWPVMTAVAATQLGTARLALDAATELLARKRSRFNAQPLIESAHTQIALLRAEGAWSAARDSIETSLQQLWAEAEHLPLPNVTRLRLFRANAHAAQTATAIVDTVAELVGTSVAPANSPFGACLRDAHVLGTHIGIALGMIEHAARVQYGLDEQLLV
jgi:alkylation response protein AidB-like acyl-CoA dehydrogenase